MFRGNQRFWAGGAVTLGLLATALYWWVGSEPAVVAAPKIKSGADNLSVHSAWQTSPQPEETTSFVAADPAASTEVQVPEALVDPAVAVKGFVGLSLEIGSGKSQTVTLNPTDVLLNKGVMLLGAKARLLGAGLPSVPANVAQSYVGAPISVSLADALQAMGGGDAQTLVGGVPIFLEVISVDSAGQTHVTRTPFEVTNRDLQADATAVLEPPPLMPALTP